MRYTQKRANPKKIIEGFQEIFKGGVSKRRINGIYKYNNTTFGVQSQIYLCLYFNLR